ncbi:MAG: DivIVA domain-containing protein [Nocardioides sp.]|uniref:DivIVA domain-containing protein n=1 Tax=Nocardioides sp. TaxID=35761 RepID=UPI0039E6117D
MMWVFAIVVVLLMGAVAVVAAGHGEPMSSAHSDRRDVLVPTDRRLDASDLREVRFTVGAFGYRTDEVDALLARLARELDARDTPPPAPEEPEDSEDPDGALPEEPAAESPDAEDAADEATPAGEG